MTDGATPGAKAPKWLDAYDSEVADSFLATNEKMTGLPAFLGVRFVEFAPGRLCAEMPVKPELPVLGLNWPAAHWVQRPLEVPALPSKPALHTQWRSAVVVPSQAITLLRGHARTGLHF